MTLPAGWPTPSEDTRLAGKVAIVTGGGSVAQALGIGAASACLLARKGAAVGILDSSRERAENTLKMIEEHGGTGVTLVCDITNADDCRSAVNTVVERFGHLDILVNNAGIEGVRQEAADPDGVWDRVMTVNVDGTRNMTLAAIEALKARQCGSIINMSSIAGLRGATSPSYAASKGAIGALTRTFALAYGSSGVRVNTIAPGYVSTPMAGAGNAADDAARELRRRSNMLQSEGTAWDIAQLVVFLGSDESRWITAQTITVDAGATELAPLALHRLTQG